MPNLKTREINDNVFDMPPKHKNFRMQVIHHISILICCRSQVNKQHTVDPLFSTFDRFHSLKKIAVCDITYFHSMDANLVAVTASRPNKNCCNDLMG